MASAQASFIEARESYDIQEKQNESDIAQSELNLKFAWMDLEKYLGEKVVAKLFEQLKDNLDFNFASLSSDEELGGEALQNVRKLQSDIDLAREELSQAQTTLDWTRQLFDKDFVPRTELDSDQLLVKRRQVQVEQAETSLTLFLKYNFPKEIQKLRSDYFEAQRELERTQASARSKMAQRQAGLQSQQAKLNLQEEQLAKLRTQLEACIMRAPSEGLVVYTVEQRRWGSDSVIEVGTTVNERQKILSIPNTSEMAVEIKVHEASVDKVRPGQSAVITVDAFPEKRLYGTVTKVAPVPDQANFFMNPDLKVYKTEVHIEGSHDFLKPGMSARVEVIVEEIAKVLCIPVQSIVNRGGEKICYVAKNGGLEARTIKTGSFNDSLVQVLEGVQAGEEVSLAPPRVIGGQNQFGPATDKIPVSDKKPEEASGAERDKSDMPQGQPGMGERSNRGDFTPGERPNRGSSTPGERPNRGDRPQRPEQGGTDGASRRPDRGDS